MTAITLFVLGAPDPEMQAIERLLTEAGQRYAYALGPDGRRVHPGNAYASTAMSGPIYHSVGRIILVECGPASEGASLDWLRLGVVPGHESEADTACEVVRVDHHSPGDPGYGKSPADYLAGSSIGQVWPLLRSDPVPQDILMVAAADHCLAAAYRGECPGVEPDALMRWRAESRAAFQRRSVDEVLADIERATAILRDAPTVMIAGVPVADLGERAVPEVPEASCRAGIPFLATGLPRDGQKKQVLQSAPTAVIAEWMAAHPGSYGDPARGFAGRYISVED